MKEVVDRILEQVEADISEIDLYGYNIIETSLSMVHRLQTVLNDLRTKIQTYVFLTKEDEILFFKTQKPEILGRLLFFYKIYKIETQCPNGSDEAIRNYINRELDNLTYFFNRNLDFTNITVHIPLCTMNITLYVGKLICDYVLIAHSLTKTLISQPDMIIKWQRLSPMKCYASI